MRGPKVPLLALAATLLVVAAVVWTPLPGGLWNDDGVYLLVGKALAAGDGLRYPGVPGGLPAAKFPPLYPSILAVLWLTAREAGPVAVAAEVLNVLALVAAAVLFAAFLRRHVGLPSTAAAAVALVAWLSVDLWQYALVPLSEAVFLLLLVATLVAGARVEEGGAGWRGVAWLVAVAAALALTRTAGVPVAAAVVVGPALRARGRGEGRGLWRETLAGGVGVLVLVAPWFWWSRHATESIPAPLRDILGSYAPWLGQRVTTDPTAFLAALPGAAASLLERIHRILLPGLGLRVRWVLAVPLVAMMTWGTVILWRRTRGAALALVLYLAVLFLWPFQDRRLLMPVIPLLVTVLALPAVEGVRGLTAAVSRRDPADGGSLAASSGPRPLRRRLHHGAAVLVAVWAVFFVAVSVPRLVGGWAAAGYQVRREALTKAASAVVRVVPPDAVLGAPELWGALHLYTGRTVAPSAPFRPAGTGAPAFGTPEEQWAVWHAAGIDHLLLEQGGRIHGAALDALEARCPGSVRVLQGGGEGVLLVRLGWDEGCWRKLGETVEPEDRPSTR